MPSYLEQDQIQQLPPYLANTSAILNTFNTKVQYWAYGAARVKSAYDRYLGMDLTRDDNRMKLKEFMKGANEQMKKAAHMDLSVGDNQVEALGIFDPLVNGQTEFSKDILGDNAVTSHYKSQLATAESYRTKDNGKEYSDTNVAYLTQHLNDFANERTSGTWRNYYNARRFYTPYYDYHKEVKELMDDFKPSTMIRSTPTKGALYLHNVEDKSTTQAEALKYINANLSDKARQQMRIEGNVAWHGRDNDLVKSVAADWGADVARYQSYANDLEAKIRVSKDPIEKANMLAEQSLVNKRVSNIQDNLTKFAKGDYSEIMNNKDSYANKLYSDNLLSGIASGYVRTDFNEKYVPDQAAIQTMLESGRNSRFAIEQTNMINENALDRANALKIAEMRADATKKNTVGSAYFGIPDSGDLQTTVPLTEDNKSNAELSTSTLDADKQIQNETQQQIYSTFHDRLVSAGKINKADNVDLQHKIVDEQINAIDKVYQKYLADPRTANNARELVDADFFPGAMGMIDQLNNTKQILYSINKVKENLAPGIQSSLQAMYENGDLQVRYARGEDGEFHASDGPLNLVIDPTTLSNFVFKNDRSKIKEEKKISPDGAPYSLYTYNGRALDPSDIYRLVRSVKGIANQKYNEALVDRKPIFSFGTNAKVKLQEATTEILNSVTHKDKELKAADFQVLGYDPDSGNIYFKAESGKIKGAQETAKDKDGRMVYYIPSPNFKVDNEAMLPSSAIGLKYYFDKQLPFLQPGKTLSTPANENFFQVGGVNYRVQASKNSDLTINYELYDQASGQLLKSFPSFYLMVESAYAFPLVKNQTK